MIMIYFLNIMLTWKIVRVSKTSVLYIYIYNKSNLIIIVIHERCVSKDFFTFFIELGQSRFSVRLFFLRLK